MSLVKNKKTEFYSVLRNTIKESIKEQIVNMSNWFDKNKSVEKSNEI